MIVFSFVNSPHLVLGLDLFLPGLVELRYIGGLTIEETAETLGVSTATVERDWRSAKAWLYRAISPKKDT